jgi:hypothetical protein
VEIVPNETPGGTGGFDVILISPVYDPLEPAPEGAQQLNMSPEDEDFVEMLPDSTTGRGGEREMQHKMGDRRYAPLRMEHAQLKSMNAAAKRFWSSAR